MATILRCERCDSIHDITDVTPNICPACRLYGHLVVIDEDKYIDELAVKLRGLPSVASVDIITERDVEVMCEQNS